MFRKNRVNGYGRTNTAPLNNTEHPICKKSILTTNQFRKWIMRLKIFVLSKHTEIQSIQNKDIIL